MQRRDKVILKKILAWIDETREIFPDVSREEFLVDELLKRAMSMSVIQVGELVKSLSAEIRLENSHVPWKDIAGFRDIAAHKYETLSFGKMYITITKEFPELKSQIEKIIEEE